MNVRNLASIAAVGFLAACGSSNPSGGNDAGISLPDTGVGCAHHIPDPDHNPADAPYGTLIGRSFANFTLNDCNGNPYEFYGHDYCDSHLTFTVVSIAAGWCHPCQQESDLLTSNVVNVYGPLGVRVIQVLVQDPFGNPPDAAFCNDWVSMHGLSITPNAAGVGNYELLDPAQLTNPFFPDNALPSTIIVDSDGIIRFHEDGATESLASMTSALDRLLGR